MKQLRQREGDDMVKIYPGKRGDSVHTVMDVKLKGGAELHRFVNGGGDDYSAIYVKGEEIWPCERDHEAQMVARWNG